MWGRIGLQRTCLTVLVLSCGVCVGQLRFDKAECADGTPTDNLFACGAFHTCTANGTVTSQGTKRNIMCFGWNEFGQTNPPRGVFDSVEKIGAGARHTCATDSRGLAHCWGSNTYGQLDVPRPFTEVDPSGARTPYMPCVYCPVGEYQWDPSSRMYLRCFDESLASYSVEAPFCQPECMLPEGRKVLHIGWTRWNTSEVVSTTKPVFRNDYKHDCRVDQIAAGGQHTCLLYGTKKCSNCNFGYVRCFGNNDRGQSGVPECSDGNPPVESEIPPPAGADPSVLPTGWLECSDGSVPYSFTSIAAGMFHTCGIRASDEQIMCWGDNMYNQSMPPEGRFISVSCGAYHSCGVTVLGLVRCWGNNTYDESSNHEDLIKMEKIEEGGTFVKVGCGAVHTCGLYLPPGRSLLGKTLGKEDTGGASVVCWGANYAGQSSPPKSALSWITALSVGWEHACAVSLYDQALICWGSNNWATKKHSTQPDTAASAVPGCVSTCSLCVATINQASLVHPRSSLLILPLALASLLGFRAGVDVFRG